MKVFHASQKYQMCVCVLMGTLCWHYGFAISKSSISLSSISVSTEKTFFGGVCSQVQEDRPACCLLALMMTICQLADAPVITHSHTFISQLAKYFKYLPNLWAIDSSTLLSRQHICRLINVPLLGKHTHYLFPS